MTDSIDFSPIFGVNDNLHYAIYNTKIKTYANGEQKISYHSYNNVCGLPKVESGGKLSDDLKEHKRYSNLLRSKQNIIDLAYHNGLIQPWEYFLTLTFDPTLVDSTNYSEVGDTLKKWLNNMKKQNPGMEYIIVPEPHKSGRIHFHGIFRNVPKWKLKEARTPNNRLIKKNGLQIYNLLNYKFGYSTVSAVQDLEAVSVYISKYMTKSLIDFSYKKRYWFSSSLQRPTVEYAIFNEDTLSFYLEKKNIKNYCKKEDENKVFIFANLTANNIYYVKFYKKEELKIYFCILCFCVRYLYNLTLSLYFSLINKAI